MKIAYAIIAHQDPHHVARLARVLMESGGLVAIHYDLNAGEEGLSALRRALGEMADKVCWARQVRVGWGEWSIIEATLNALLAIAESGEAVDYVHLMSGADFPTRALSEFADYLARNGGDFIECYELGRERWITNGLTHERYRYRHVTNWRKRPVLFDTIWKAQRALGLSRSFPKGLTPFVGSQWWTLRWQTCLKVLEAGRNPELRQFFKTVWIPDEMFIQTIVAATVPASERNRRCLTLFQFTDYGVPVVYANDHAGYLARQPFFFARKLSRHATALREELAEVALGRAPSPTVADSEIGTRTGEYETARLAGRLPVPGRRTMGRDADRWKGDLAWNDRLFVAVMGASLAELKVLQQVLTATGRLECHGALFDPERVDFAGHRRQLAGYERTDVKLRDHRRTTFLSDVIMATAPSTCGFLLPWKRDEEIRDKILWSRHAAVLCVRGNVFRALLEHQAAAGAAGGSGQARSESHWINPGVLATFHREMEDYYAEVARVALNSGVTYAEIDLLGGDWLQRTRDFIDCAIPPPVSGKVSPILPLTPELAERLIAQLPDPAAQIANIRGLVELRLPPPEADLYRDLLGYPRRAAPEGRGALAGRRDQASQPEPGTRGARG